jgi:hypothetical protein
MIPERSGIGYQPQSAASHEQLSHVPGHIRPSGDGGYCLAGFCVAAGETSVLAKSDRLELSTVARNCSQQVWPRFDAQCLHSGETMVREVRLVTARR